MEAWIDSLLQVKGNVGMRQRPQFLCHVFRYELNDAYRKGSVITTSDKDEP